MAGKRAWASSRGRGKDKRRNHGTGRGSDGADSPRDREGDLWSRQGFTGPHPGSYAGDLKSLLSDEERAQLDAAIQAAGAQGKAAGEDPEEAAADSSGAATGKDTASGAEDVAGDDATGNDATGSGRKAFKKRKVALALAYCGSRYQGFQMNEGVKSIEAELERAMFLAGAIGPLNFGNLQKVQWSKVARTDKGVHAAAQVITAKLVFREGGEDQLVDDLNRHLPEDVRILEALRVGKGFNPKHACSKRRYEYLLPTSVLVSEARVAELLGEAQQWASQASDTTDAGNSDCKGSGGGVVGKGPPTTASAAPTPSSSPAATAAAAAAAATPTGGTDARGPGVASGAEEAGGSSGGGSSTRGSSASSGGGGGHSVGKDGDGAGAGAGADADAVMERVAQGLREFRVGPEALSALREVLGWYVGTRNYHNLTSHRKADDPSCSRYITSFTAGEPWVREEDGREWVRLQVDGQSFLLHQIRKMVGVAVDVARGGADKDCFEWAFSKDKMTVPLAPSDGLYLERPFFDKYNARCPEGQALRWETGPATERLERFKEEKIVEHILAREATSHNFTRWLYNLHAFPGTYRTDPATTAATTAPGSEPAAGAQAAAGGGEPTVM